MKNKRGITLIALVITIIVILILAAVSLNLIAESGLFHKTNEAKFKTQMAKHKESVELYTSWKVIETMNTNTNSINSGEVLKELIEQEIVEDIKQEDVTINVEEIIKDIKKTEKEYIVVYKGQLCYVSNPERENDAKYKKWCEELNIPILEYVVPTGILVKNGKYELVNGIYLCTPKLNEGLPQEKTRYMNINTKGKMAPGNWISNKPDEDWYSYKESKWANIYIENDGLEAYYTWIPRYCFKLDQDKQKSDVKFIDMENNYKDENGTPTLWEELEGQGYQVPEAFTYNGQPIPGYWVMKYTAGDRTVPATIYYDMAGSSGEILIKNITLNTTITSSNRIVKYTFALNGKIQETIDNSTTVSKINNEVIVLKDIKPGDNIVNVTGLNANGEVVGSMTKTYSPAIVNKPDLSKFDKNTTFYVTYDDKGNEFSTVPISQEAPIDWYNYGDSKWANIVIRNNGLEAYYVWIPRYQFTLDQNNQRSIVKFLSGTAEAEPGYQVPEAFTYNGQVIPGYWVMKYTAGEEEAATFTTELTATGDSIITSGITGTKVASGQIYRYYINGEYKYETTNKAETYQYTGLKNGETYTVLIEIRNKSTNKYIGTIVKQIETIAPNKPDLTGFNEARTYYVTFDSKGKAVIGENIKNDGSNMKDDWYDYSQKKWANIVITDGKVENGTITGATLTAYYTWIPRYQFRLDQLNQRTLVNFVKGISKEVIPGYQIPEAFTFNGKEIPGYWTMKYTAGE